MGAKDYKYGGNLQPPYAESIAIIHGMKERSHPIGIKNTVEPDGPRCLHALFELARGIPLTLSLRAVPSAHWRLGSDPFTASDELGLQVRSSAFTFLHLVIRKQAPYHNVLATVSVVRTCGDAASSATGP